MARLCFDLDGTLVGKVGDQYVLRNSVFSVAKNRKARGDTIVLWTFGNRAWWNRVKQMFPVLGTLFSETYTRDELPGHVTTVNGGPAPVKDIRLIACDVLVDNDPSHHEWAARHGLAARYVKVSTMGE
jgi:hypothetical protein